MHVPPQAVFQPHEDLKGHILPLTPPQSPRSLSLKCYDELISRNVCFEANMEELAGNHLHRLLGIQLSNGEQLVLKVGPEPSTLLLRHEGLLLRSEATACCVLAKSRLPVPRLLKYERSSGHLGAPFLLLSRLEGIRYADALLHLSAAERSKINRQLASIAAAINQHTSPRFGFVGLAQKRSSKPGSAQWGHKTWQEAFVTMMEDLLMDGEDMAVNLPYFHIREALSRWDSYLSEVSEARLVALDLDRPENVLIDPNTNEVSGILDLGFSIWGDPMMAKPEGKTDIRSLLYACYRAMLTIVRNNYRADDDFGELEARKSLTMALSHLAMHQ